MTEKLENPEISIKLALGSLCKPNIGKSMDFIGFRWISCGNHGFGTVGVPRCVMSIPKHFGSVLGVIGTREETPRVFILLGIDRSELTCLKWTTKGSTYCSAAGVKGLALRASKG